jgi:hypothetical protein
LLSSALVLAAAALVQDVAVAPAAQSVVGEVTAVRAEDRSLAVRTDAGEAVVINVGEKTVLLRSRPGAKSLAEATPLALADVAPGDRVLVNGTALADRTAFAARRVVVMTRDDVEARHQQEREDWRRRGLSGVVVGLDAATKEITLRLRSTPGQETVVVAADGRDVAFRRYAPDSVKFSDARTSSFEELHEGDQVRVLGEHGPEGARVLPEQIVSGAFQTVRGLVSSVDSAHGQVSLRDVEPESKGPLTVAVGQDAVLRRLPPGLAGRLSGPAGGETAGPTTRRGSVEDMLERLPAITLADLQPGEAVAVLSTKGTDPRHLTAIKLVAGLPSSAPTGAGARRRRSNAGTDLGVPSGVFDFGGDLPW